MASNGATRHITGTALGSFLRFTGAACHSFAAIVREPGFPVLAEALQASRTWKQFFGQANLSAPLDTLETALERLMDDGDFRREALEEYNELFHAPDLITPLWESVWLSKEKLLFTEETFAVRDWYARFGWEIHRAGFEAEDHIGLETAFCGWLYDLDARAQAGDSLNEPQLRTFLREHYSLWAPCCFTALRQAARTPFWTSLLTAAEQLAEALAEIK